MLPGSEYLVLLMRQSHCLEVKEIPCIEHLLCARYTMFSKHPLNEWSPLTGISQPTRERKSYGSYCKEEKTEAQRGQTILPGSRPHSDRSVRSLESSRLQGSRVTFLETKGSEATSCCVTLSESLLLGGPGSPS